MNKSTRKFLYSIPSREEILRVLRCSQTSLNIEQIANLLTVRKEEHDGFIKRIAAMVRDGQINIDERDYIKLMPYHNFIAGRVQGHRDGFGFLVRDDGQMDLFLSRAEMEKTMHGDRVLARIVGIDRRGRPEGRIVEIVEHVNKRVVGRLMKENGILYVLPEDIRLVHNILVKSKGLPSTCIGQIVTIEISDFPTRYSQASGYIVEVLGDINAPGMEIEIALRKYRVPHDFPENVLKQASALPDEVQHIDLKQRVDLRTIPLVTIDSEDARDFDDAVYCESLQIGQKIGFRLLVAIADVSHYVRPGDALDVSAIERSTSIYFPQRVIPMFPEKLSNELCSLKPNVDRCALVCDMLINSQGVVKSYQFYPAVIHSVARLTYTEVAAALSNNQSSSTGRCSILVPHLRNLEKAYQALSSARKERGAIDFETTESYILYNPKGKIQQILPRIRNDAHKLIEECMLAANVCAAELLRRHKHPALFRVHAKPNAEKIRNLRIFLKNLGLTLGGGRSPHASDYATLIKKIKGRTDALMLQTMLLRSMQQAVYSPDNEGHFGLACEAYAHFTSPIRRYPDLLIHRAIRAILAGKQYIPTTPEHVLLNTTLKKSNNFSESKKNSLKVSKALEHASNERLIAWEKLGMHCSANERRADEAERDVENWLKCYFMHDKLGEEYDGLISGVTPFGVFVQLDTLFIEGLIHISELGNDYFQYDEVHNQLCGERTGIRFRLTDRVRIRVARVDLNSKKIYFQLVNEPASSSTDTLRRINMDLRSTNIKGRKYSYKIRKLKSKTNSH